MSKFSIKIWLNYHRVRGELIWLLVSSLSPGNWPGLSQQTNIQSDTIFYSQLFYSMTNKCTHNVSYQAGIIRSLSHVNSENNYSEVPNVLKYKNIHNYVLYVSLKISTNGSNPILFCLIAQRIWISEDCTKLN